MSHKSCWNMLTAVSAVLMLAPAAWAQVTVHGLDHTAVGAASLSVLPGGDLEVSGLLSIDDDAVRLDVDHADGGALSVHGVSEGVLRVSSRHRVGGTLDVQGGTLELQRLGGSMLVHGVAPTFTPTQPGTYTFQLTVVDNVGLTTVHPPQVGGGLLGTLSYGATGIPDGGTLLYRKKRRPTHASTSEDRHIFVFSEDLSSSGASGIRSAIVTMDVSTDSSLYDSSPSSVHVSGTGASAVLPLTLTSDDGALYVFGGYGAHVVENSTSHVRLDPTSEGLRVSSSSGGSLLQEGVTFRLNSISDADIADDPLTVAAAHSGLPTGRRVHSPLTMTKDYEKSTPKLMEATVSGVDSSSGLSGEGTLYVSSVDNVGNGDTVLSSDFSSVGSSSYEVRVLQGGVQVALATGTSVSQVLLEDATPVVTVEEVSMNYNEIKWSYKKRSGSSSATLPGGAVVPLNPALSTEVVFEALGASSSGLRVTSVTDVFTGSGSVLYTHVSAVPEPSSIALTATMLAAAWALFGKKRRSLPTS